MPAAFSSRHTDLTHVCFEDMIRDIDCGTRVRRVPLCTTSSSPLDLSSRCRPPERWSRFGPSAAPVAPGRHVWVVTATVYKTYQPFKHNLVFGLALGRSLGAGKAIPYVGWFNVVWVLPGLLAVRTDILSNYVSQLNDTAPHLFIFLIP